MNSTNPSTVYSTHTNNSFWTDSPVACAMTIGLALWLVGRLWSLVPAKDAEGDEPPYLSYSIPSFARDSSKVYNAAFQRFGLRPFTLKIAGQKHYVFTRPEDVVSIFKASRSLTFDGSVSQFLAMVYAMKDEPEISVDELLKGGKVLSDGNILEDPHSFYRRELSGASLEHLIKRSVEEIENELSAQFSRFNSDGAPLEVGFLLWARDLLSNAVTTATFGPRFLKRFPGTIDALWTLDDGTYKLLDGYPERFARGVYAAREELVNSLKVYLDEGEASEELREGALSMVLGRDEMVKTAGLSLDGRARSVLTILQAVHTNSAPTTFWLIAQIVTIPGLLKRILDEVSPAYRFTPGSSKPIVDIAYLTSPKSCPLLHSTYLETLRIAASTISVRVVDKTTNNIGGYTVHKGAKVFIPGRPLHLSQEFWGTEADKFNPDRFVTRPQDGVSMKMRPFGGGATLCPGRHFAAAEVKAFVAGALMRFGFIIPNGVPEIDVKTPVLGVLRPAGPCNAKISRRAQWSQALFNAATFKSG